MTAVALHHVVTGPADAPTVVFSGSLGTRLTMWDPQVQALSDRFRIVRCDVRGHGGSPVPPGPYAIDDLGADLLALLQALDARRVRLVGLSIGAMMSLWVAAHAPEHVGRLVACCTTARFGPEATDAYVSRAAAARAHGLADLADGVVARWFTPEFAATRPDVVARFRAELIATPREGYAACCEALAALDLTGLLGRITAPTLVISGADDQATPPSHGEAIAAAVPGARFVCLDAAAHLGSVQQPERVNDLVAAFFEEA
jgi:3-oxoadipate enol-lactonase